MRVHELTLVATPCICDYIQFSSLHDAVVICLAFVVEIPLQSTTAESLIASLQDQDLPSF